MANPGTGKLERRAVIRRPLIGEIWADPGGTALPILCEILDISDHGAKLSVNPGTELPDSFFLKFGEVLHRVKVVWKRGVHSPRVGVMFEALAL